MSADIRPVGVVHLPLPSVGTARLSALGVTLPSPKAEAPFAGDVVSMFMALVEEQSLQGVKQSLSDVRATQERLRDAHEAFLKKLDDIAKKAAENAHKRNSGWGFLGDIVDAVAEFATEVIGPIVGGAVEGLVDVIRAPIDIAVGLAQGKSLIELVNQEVNDLTSQGKLAKSTTNALRGAVNFARDAANSLTSFAGAIASGKNPASALAQLGGELWNGLCHNVLENPDLMQALKVGLGALTVLSAGAMMPAVLAVLAASTLIQMDGVAEALVGKAAAPYLKMAVAIAAGVAVGLMSGPGLLQRVVSSVNAGLDVAQGVRTVQLAAQQRELNHDKVDLVALQMRAATLQRFLQYAIDLLEERAEDRDDLRAQGAQAAKAQATVSEAAYAAFALAGGAAT